MQEISIENTYGTQEAHAKLLEMLKDFHSFCVKNNISYSLTGGSLLGAVRHNGFIPWDDDVDVILDRENYNKFVECISSPAYTGEYKLNKILWIHRLQKNEENTSGFSPTIDLFVVDNSPENSIKRKLKVIKLKILQGMMKEKINYKNFSLPYKICLFATHIFGKLFTYNFKWKRYVAISKSSNKNETPFVSVYNDLFKYISLRYPSSMMKNLSLHKFEDTEVYITDDWDKYLTTVFGDYMTPPKEEDRVPGHLE